MFALFYFALVEFGLDMGMGLVIGLGHWALGFEFECEVRPKTGGINIFPKAIFVQASEAGK